jgi:hypothetical protein
VAERTNDIAGDLRDQWRRSGEVLQAYKVELNESPDFRVAAQCAVFVVGGCTVLKLS